jgi:hypothetical protein
VAARLAAKGLAGPLIVTVFDKLCQLLGMCRSNDFKADMIWIDLRLAMHPIARVHYCSSNLPANRAFYRLRWPKMEQIMILRTTGVFLALAIALPSVAAAQSTDQFNNLVPPAISNENPTAAALYPYAGKSPMQRLQKICSSEKRSDRQTCKQAWREINDAYAKLKSGEATIQR